MAYRQVTLPRAAARGGQWPAVAAAVVAVQSTCCRAFESGHATSASGASCTAVTTARGARPSAIALRSPRAPYHSRSTASLCVRADALRLGLAGVRRWDTVSTRHALACTLELPLLCRALHTVCAVCSPNQ